MIRRIRTIKNLGIFNDYKEKVNLPEFEKFNLIYGLNGSGKSTLSEFFNALKNGKLDGFSGLKYSIKADGKDENYTHMDSYPKNIKVFNQEYVKNNIDIDSGKANPIRMIIGAENKELIEQIKKDGKTLIEREEKIQKKNGEISQKKEKTDRIFTHVARIIGGGRRTYDRRDAKTDFDKLEKKEILLPEDVDKNQNTLSQEQKDSVNIVGDFITQDFFNIITRAQELLSKTVEISMIEELNKNKDVSRWVEEGLKLHRELNSKSCEFCRHLLPKERILKLLGHFNDDDKKIKNAIDVLLKDIDIQTSGIKNIKVPDEARLYDNMKEEYLSAKEEIKSSEALLLEDIKKLRAEIENKKQHTTESLLLSVNICSKEFISSIEACNVLISGCNERTANFETEKNEAKAQLKNHHLSEIYDEVRLIDDERKNAERECYLLENGDPEIPGDVAIDKIKERILENKNKLSNTIKACGELNKKLKDFLGRDELTFESSGHKYLIMRKGIPARKLSEGEKTAIAFVYFTIHLKEEDFNIEDSIVVIDDPVSSLDSNSLVGASAFLKEAIKDAHQSFIFTHNLDFLRLSLKWLKSVSRSEKKYYMVQNPDDGNNRIAILTLLNKLLENYDNEYEYLLGCLENLNGGTMESTYHIPNMARKVLEHFLMFMGSGNGTMRQKMEKINFGEVEKDSMCSFFNDRSHMSDGNVDLSQECKKNVGYLLDMIGTVTLRGRGIKE